jgi:hypothetical protein
MGHPMAKKSFRFRGEKVLKNRKQYQENRTFNEDEGENTTFNAKNRILYREEESQPVEFQ